MVQSEEERDFVERIKKILTDFNRRGIKTIFFGQAALRSYALLKEIEIRKTKDLDFVINPS